MFGWGNRRAVATDSAARPDVIVGTLQGENLYPDKIRKVAGEKRDLERVPLEEEVRGEVMVFQPMTILDISLAGAMIETAFALQLDSLHDFRLSLGDRSVILKGRIAYCHIGKLTDIAALYRIGVEFVDLSEHVRSAIADFVRASQSARGAPKVVDGIIAPDEEGSP